MVAEYGGKRDAALGHGREDRAEGFFHCLRGSDGRAVDLIAGEYDKIGVGGVKLCIEQTDRRLLRGGGVLRVGNDQNAKFSVLVKLEHGILPGGIDRRGEICQQQRRERRAQERFPFFHIEPSE